MDKDRIETIAQHVVDALIDRIPNLVLVGDTVKFEVFNTLLKELRQKCLCENDWTDGTGICEVCKLQRS